MLNMCGGTIVGTASGPTDETTARTTVGAFGGTIVAPTVGTTIGTTVGTVVGPIGGTTIGSVIGTTIGPTVGAHCWDHYFSWICCVNMHLLEWTTITFNSGPLVLGMDH